MCVSGVLLSHEGQLTSATVAVETVGKSKKDGNSKHKDANIVTNLRVSIPISFQRIIKWFLPHWGKRIHDVRRKGGVRGISAQTASFYFHHIEGVAEAEDVDNYCCGKYAFWDRLTLFLTGKWGCLVRNGSGFLRK